MTERGGGSSDYDSRDDRKNHIHVAALRVAASPGPRGWYYTSRSYCLAAPLEGGGIKAAGWRALLLLWSLIPLLWSFAGQLQAVVCWYVTDK